MVRRYKTTRKAKTKVFSKREAKAVAKIAKKVDLSDDETKMLALTCDATVALPTPIFSYCVTKGLAQGTSSNAMIGRSAFLSRLSFNGMVSRVGQGGDSQGTPAYARVLVLWSAAQKTTLSASDIFIDSTIPIAGSTGFSRARVDYNKVVPTYDKLVRLTPNYVNQMTSIQLKYSKKINKKITFPLEPLGSQYVQYPTRGNLYVVVVYDTTTYATIGATPNIGFQANMLLSYKDA